MKRINNYIQEKLHISKNLVKPRIYSVFVKTGLGKYVPEIFNNPQEALQFIIDNNVSIKAIYGFRKKEDAEKLTDITYKMVRGQIDKETAEKIKKALDYVMIKGDDVERIIAGKANIEDFLTEKLHIDKDYKPETLADIILNVFDFNDYEKTRNFVHNWIKRENVKEVEFISDFDDEFYIPKEYKCYVKYDKEKAEDLNNKLILAGPKFEEITQEEYLFWADDIGILCKANDNESKTRLIFVNKIS